MMTSFIDVMFVTNDINIINIDKHNANIRCSFLDENTYTIIIDYVSLMLKEYSTDCTTFGLIVLSHIMTSAT
jgi:hypothetical protein